MRAWALPEHLEDVLPPLAWRMEEQRRALLDLFRSRGYELVIPPLIEYVDSLLSGAAAELDLKTFKLVDQLSGRLMGVRADITPQVARIDAHLLAHNAVNRLCYVGSVLHTTTDSFHRNREPVQIGAECYGVAGIEADGELVRLMLDGLAAAGVGEVQLDLGHVGIVRELAREARFEEAREHELFAALQAKDGGAVADLTATLAPLMQNAFAQLIRLYGGAEVLAEARRVLPPLPALGTALDDLDRLAQGFSGVAADVAFDLAELRGYGYHSGAVFAAYTAGRSRAIALGGRYDDVGRIFGRARPATGFSMDLRELAQASPAR